MGRIPDIDIELPEEQHPPEDFRDIGNAE